MVIEWEIPTPKAKMAGFYAVRVGRTPGVFTTWDACKASVDGHKGAVYKKFATRSEAEAWVGGDVVPPRRQEDVEAVTLYEQICDVLLPEVNGVRRSEMTSLRGVALRLVDGIMKVNITLDTLDIHMEAEQKVIKDQWTSPCVMFTLERPRLIVYTDGSCTSNGQAGARAGVGVHWPCASYPELSFRLLGHPTNQRAELAAVLAALRQTATDPRLLEVRTDSKYTIDILTEWMQGWKRRGWTTSSGGDVQNRDLIEALDDALRTRAGRVTYTHVRGHAGEPGNEAADALARAGGLKEIE